MAICRCKNNRCTCLITGGFGIDVSGNGTERNPYVAQALAWSLTGSEGETADVTVTGTGVVGDPYVVTITTDGQTFTRTLFNANGTWVNPNAGTVAQVICIGGGGGGGGARATGGILSPSIGGSGGGGGAMSVSYFPIAGLPGTVEVVVGAGGAGGIPGLTYYGAPGGTSRFGQYLVASGGGGTDPSQFIYVPSGGGQIGTPPEGGYGGAGAHFDPGNVVVEADSMANSLGAGGGGIGFSDTSSATEGFGSQVSQWPSGKGGDGGAPGVGFGPKTGDLYGGGGGGGHDDSSYQSGAAGAPGVVIVTTW